MCIGKYHHLSLPKPGIWNYLVFSALGDEWEILSFST